MGGSGLIGTLSQIFAFFRTMSSSRTCNLILATICLLQVTCYLILDSCYLTFSSVTCYLIIVTWIYYPVHVTPYFHSDTSYLLSDTPYMLPWTCYPIFVSRYFFTDTFYPILDSQYLWTEIVKWSLLNIFLVIQYLLTNTCYVTPLPDTFCLILFTLYFLHYTCYTVLATLYLLPDNILPETWYLIYSKWFLVPDIWYLIFDIWCLILETWYLTPNICYLIMLPNTLNWYILSDTSHVITGTC